MRGSDVRVRVIVPHHNRHDMLARLLRSIPEGTEVSVMCGGSYAQNCNRGADPEAFYQPQSNLRYLFVNDDCVLDPGIIEAAHRTQSVTGFLMHEGVTYLDRANAYGKTVQPQPDPEFHTASFLTPVLEEGVVRIELLRTLPDGPRLGSVLIPSGACFAIDAHLFHLVGGFNDQFVNGCEDIDLFLRCMEANAPVAILPEMDVIHGPGKSAGRFDHIDQNRALLAKVWPVERVARLAHGGPITREPIASPAPAEVPGDARG